MIDITGLKIRELCVHRVGNLLRREGVQSSDAPQKIRSADQLPLIQFLFGNLSRLNSYDFMHSVDVELNTISGLATAISSEAKPLKRASAEIAAHLYSVSNHPRVKAGNLFVGTFDGIKIDGKTFSVLGIFKSDAVDDFVKAEVKDGKSSLIVDQGASLTSLDKIALILLSPKGKPKCVLAACSRGEEAVFWTERFLQLAPSHSPKADTKACLEVCRAFAKSGDESETADPDRILFLNRTLQFFESSERYDEARFASVFTSKAQEQEFQRFRAEQEATNQWNIPDQFEIEKGAVRTERIKFQRNIKLDSNIEIRLRFKDHKEMSKRVERGFDPERKLHFFKLYYSTEK